MAGIDAARVRTNLERVREEVGEKVEICAAVRTYMGLKSHSCGSNSADMAIEFSGLRRSWPRIARNRSRA